MTDETRLLDLLRSALPPATAAFPSRDLWPLVLKRGAERREWSWFDVVLTVGVAIALLSRPGLLVFLAYHF